MRARGTLTVITGTMFSGKTKELHHLIERLRIFRKKCVLIFKPKTDTRSRKGFTQTQDRHSLKRLRAIEIDPNKTEVIVRLVLNSQVDVVAFDEIQFFPPQSGFFQVVDSLLSFGYDVVASGLDLDFAGRPFGSTPFLLALVGGNPNDKIVKLEAFCKKCNAPARLPQRLVSGKPAPYNSPLIRVGGRETYEPRCYSCHELPGKPSLI